MYIDHFIEYASVCQDILLDTSEESNIFAIHFFDEMKVDLLFAWELLSTDVIHWENETEKNHLIKNYAGSFPDLLNNRFQDELKVDIYKAGIEAAQNLGKTQEEHIILGNLGTVY